MKRASTGHGLLEACENVGNVAAERVFGKKIIRCGTSVEWWGDESREAIKERRETPTRNTGMTIGTNVEEFGFKRKQAQGIVIGKKKESWDEVVQEVNTFGRWRKVHVARD